MHAISASSHRDTETRTNPDWEDEDLSFTDPEINCIWVARAKASANSMEPLQQSQAQSDTLEPDQT